MFLFPKKNTNLQLDKFLLPVLLLLLVFLSYYNFIFLENARPGKILQDTLQSMEENYDTFDIEIIERGEGYRIYFTGSLKDKDIIYGNIAGHKLDIYKHSSGELFIKDLKDGIWKSAAELKLDSLHDFFVSPLKLLPLWSHLFKNAKLINYPDSQEKIIQLNISPQEMEEAGIFKDYFQDGSFWLECLVFIDPENLFINQVVLSLYDQKKLESILSRTFSIRHSENGFPDAIPALILGDGTGRRR